MLNALQGCLLAVKDFNNSSISDSYLTVSNEYISVSKGQRNLTIKNQITNSNNISILRTKFSTAVQAKVRSTTKRKL
jgi:hypothetical protein